MTTSRRHDHFTVAHGDHLTVAHRDLAVAHRDHAAEGHPAQLLVEWAACMRSHGDPNQADPTITVNKLISIPWNGAAIPGGYNGTNQGGQGNLGPGQYCRAYLAAAQAALRGGRQVERPGLAAQVKFAECMRANGVPDYPDPGANGGLTLRRSRHLKQPDFPERRQGVHPQDRREFARPQRPTTRDNHARRVPAPVIWTAGDAESRGSPTEACSADRLLAVGFSCAIAWPRPPAIGLGVRRPERSVRLRRGS